MRSSLEGLFVVGGRLALQLRFLCEHIRDWKAQKFEQLQRAPSVTQGGHGPLPLPTPVRLAAN